MQNGFSFVVWPLSQAKWPSTPHTARDSTPQSLATNFTAPNSRLMSASICLPNNSVCTLNNSPCLPSAFACADILLSRAGSNSLSEILALCKPALLIPYHSGRGDQVLNANSLKARGLAHVMLQSELSAQSLPAALDALWEDRDLLVQRMRALPDADGTQAVLAQIYRYARQSSS